MKLVLPEDRIFLSEVPGQDFDQDAIIFEAADGSRVAIANDLRHQPDGIRSYSTHSGVCQGGTLDFTLITLDAMGVGKAVYTRSLSCSEAVRFDRNNTAHGDIQSVCVVSKNANVFTPNGMRDIEAMAARIQSATGVHPANQIISCTGVIGVPLPMERILAAIDSAPGRLVAGELEQSANAILTTDKKAKFASVEFGDIRLCGFAKGAGMIEPNMATMLAYFFTDAKVEKVDLERILKRAADKTFNAISVDTDTSTSDTVAVISTDSKPLDAAGLVDFERALTALFYKLSRDILAQAEGARCVIEANVSVSSSAEDARLFAKKIINSPLIKTAVHGCDPNWGRVVMAVGKPTDRFTVREIQQNELRIVIMDQVVFEFGRALPLDLERLSSKMRAAKTVTIEVQIGSPVYSAKAWGCDLSEAYVKINADYTT
ncbi:bifunctional glutamate N-acetyltransferase/amino-acid acetyltransferase ArgJ [Nocardia concava]|uniref:bifunctional glutamate N-acetyltransferase/amino-acid acetyltransferase ArgJ n=1 Tax=Nocardia concava TaxID=257281 RepID=UPI0002F5B269|nr:bifunctional glutamate N-acetyltransferase/amino-acid acetyltransferase ArgJ [Nocardia concava]